MIILMKRALVILPMILLLGLSSLTSSPISAFAQDSAPQFTEVTIEAGSRVGPLKLGDSRERVLELLPKKEEDQEWSNNCGTTIDWVDSTNRTGRGDVFVRLNKKGKVFQIESSTTRFHTSEGITT
ncbi:MAG: hypothetical protein DMG79_16480, partial [Acidobacteria bacterium]